MATGLQELVHSKVGLKAKYGKLDQRQNGRARGWPVF